MDKLATFFWNREEGSGAEYEVNLRGPESRCLVQVFSRQTIQSSQLRDQTFKDDKALETIINSLYDEVGKLGKGGLVVSTIFRAKESRQWVQIVPATGSSFKAPGSYLLLEPGHPPQLKKLDQTPINIKDGAHLIVPVDETAQGKLKSLLEYLRWYSPDLESLVLNTIRQPSLERRLERIERMRQPGKTDSARTPGLLARLRPLFAPVVIALLAVILVLVYQIPERLAARTGADDSSAGSGQVSGGAGQQDGTTQPGTGDPDAAEPVAIGAMAEALISKLASFPADDPVGVLYASHFESLAGTGGDEILKNEVFAWGMVKLLAIRHDKVDTDGKRYSLRDIEWRSDAKRMLGDLNKILGSNELSMIATVTCSAFAENRDQNQAGLPSVAGDTVSGRVDIAVKCEAASAAAAVQGLRDLIAYLDSRALQLQGGEGTE
jgi:hypothetical protein